MLLGSVVYGSWGYTTRAGLLKANTPPQVAPAVCRRIVIAQSLYAFGALLCIVSTYLSIGFIVLVQLNYAIAPRYFSRSRQ